LKNVTGRFELEGLLNDRLSSIETILVVYTYYHLGHLL
jgi:hypothetical protein